MPKRRERVAPPPRPDGWDFRFANNAAANGWDQLCRDVPSNTWTAWDAIVSDPRRRNTRQHPLRGPRRQCLVSGVEMEQWQYEVTSGGRIWYGIDDAKRTIWMTHAGTGHPKATE